MILMMMIIKVICLWIFIIFCKLEDIKFFYVMVIMWFRDEVFGIVLVLFLYCVCDDRVKRCLFIGYWFICVGLLLKF